MTELVSWLNTDTLPAEFLLTEALLRCFAEAKVLQEDATEAVLQWRSELWTTGAPGPHHAPDAARCALGD